MAVGHGLLMQPVGVNAPLSEGSWGDASATTPRLGYSPALDGLRGVAILLVILFHMQSSLVFCCFAPGGFVGVDVFFVLSGFLITTLILERIDVDRGLRPFYRRRALRLLPALLFFLVIHALVMWLMRPDVLTDVRSGTLMSLSYVMNWFEAAGQVKLRSLSHTWSLAVEEQFYVVWPIILLFLHKRMSAISLSRYVAAAIVGIMLWRALLFFLGAEWHELQYRTDTRADALLVGAWIALRKPTLDRLAQPLMSTLASAAMALIIALAFLLPVSHPAWYYGGLTIIAVLAAFVLVAALDGRWSLHSTLVNRHLTRLGRLSYSVYLWHGPIFLGVVAWGPSAVAARVALAFALTTVMSAISYVFIEKPFLHLKRVLERRQDARSSTPLQRSVMEVAPAA